MNPKRILLIIFGILLFASGSVINLFFSSNLLWGEMEARLYTPQTGDKALDIACPLMIAAWESATINTVVINTITEETKPQVNAFISQAQAKSPRVVSETLLLEAFESRAMQWTVDATDIIFERLILVNILQRPYRDLESQQGACSIFVYSLFGLDGKNTLILIVEVGVLATLLGIGLLFYLFRPFTPLTKKLLHSNILFLVFVFTGLLASLNRLWGLTLFFNSTALLIITVATVEILLGSKK